VAVGVHTTQFAIRDPKHGLLEPVLRCGSEVLDEIDRREAKGATDSEAAHAAESSVRNAPRAPQAPAPRREPSDAGTDDSARGLAALSVAPNPPAQRRLLRIAGVCGPTAQAVREAELAASLGYHAGLLSLAALPDADDDALIEHCRAVARVIPLFGFYLQTVISCRPLGVAFWRRFAEIENVVAIKIAPFNRYQTLDVVRGVAESGRAHEVALYTGNDDNIVADLLTRFDVRVDGRTVSQRIVGGLLGHCAVWTKASVDWFNRLKLLREGDAPLTEGELSLNAAVTDMNAAIFDPAHGFAGCIPAIQHVLHGQGLLASPRCLDANERLSPGQAEAIERVRQDYPALIDDAFVAERRDVWLRA
jgi:hypothetical protein